MKLSEVTDDCTVYVRNLSNTDINITITDKGDTPVLLVIAKSPIPQEVTEIVTSDILRRDSNFKRILASNAIELVENEIAEVELNTKEGKLLLAHLKKSKILPTELRADYDETVTPMDVLGENNQESIRPILRDLVIDNTRSPEDVHAEILMADKEEDFSREEIDFLLSSLSDEYFDALQYVKGKRSSLLNNIDDTKTKKKKKGKS